MFSRKLTFEVHYGGRLEFEPLLTYVDEKICCFDEVDIHFLSHIELVNSLKRFGLSYDQEIYYKFSNCTFGDGLRALNSDSSIVGMVEHHLLLDIAILYIGNIPEPVIPEPVDSPEPLFLDFEKTDDVNVDVSVDVADFSFENNGSILNGESSNVGRGQSQIDDLTGLT